MNTALLQQALEALESCGYQIGWYCEMPYYDEKLVEDSVKTIRAHLASSVPIPDEPECKGCNGTGDVHSFDGDWRGTCFCAAGDKLRAKKSDITATDTCKECNGDGYVLGSQGTFTCPECKPASPAPNDWVLVPRVPTPAMCVAGFLVSEAEHDPSGVYSAMLSAAPPAPKAASPVPEFEYVGVVAKSTMCVTVAWVKELPHNTKLYVVPASKVEVNSTPNTCQWASMDDYPYDGCDYPSGGYDTSCGQTWSFIDGGIAENGIKFCHNCGKPVVEVTL